MKTLKRQAFGKYREELSSGIAGLLEQLETAAKQDKWLRGLQQQTPKQLWRHDNALTSYQIWVMYRLALGQLNLYHEGRQQDNACRKTPTCRDRKETLSHIFWDCPCAKTCWKWLIRKWTGYEDDSMDISMYRDYCAARKAPPGESMKGRLTLISGKYKNEDRDVLERLWRILVTVCCTTLWIQRNRVVFEGEIVTREQSCAEFQATAIKQAKAIARREKRAPETAEEGVRLDYCVEAFLQTPDKPTRETVSAMKLAKQSPLVAKMKFNIGF